VAWAYSLRVPRSRSTLSPDVTAALCRVPEREFSRSPEDSLLAYLCRFPVRAPLSSLEDFLGSVESGTSVLYFPPHDSSGKAERIFLSGTLTAWAHTSIGAHSLSCCVPPSFKRKGGGTAISTCYPSPTPFGLGLGPD